MMNMMEMNSENTSLVSAARRYHSPAIRIIQQTVLYRRPADTDATRFIWREHINGIGGPPIHKLLCDRTQRARPVSTDRR